MPVQIWATWFPAGGKPQSFIQGYPLENLAINGGEGGSFHFRVGDCEIGDDSCRGNLEVGGHRISWNLFHSSSFGTTLSNKGWIGFSQTPHSDARFSGKITLDNNTSVGEPLGFGVEGHNCGYRHRGFWMWCHACFLIAGGSPATLEALVYDMPFGLIFRKAVLWHKGRQYVFTKLRNIVTDRNNFVWSFSGSNRDGLQLEASFDGSGPSMHRLDYLKTDCSGSFEVVNNSLAKALVRLTEPNGQVEELGTNTGAVLEMGGKRKEPAVSLLCPLLV